MLNYHKKLAYKTIRKDWNLYKRLIGLVECSSNKLLTYEIVGFMLVTIKTI